MSSLYFDDDVPLGSLDFSLGSSSDGRSESAAPSGGASLHVDSGPKSSQSRSRPRGGRGQGKSNGSGSRGSGAQGTPKPRWRSGQIPAAPTFDGDIDQDPYCLRHYRKRLSRWVRITKEFLPPNEQALRAREQLKGEAELEFEEVPDDRFDHPDGISRLLADLEESFGEKEIFRQGGAVREYESIGRMQGESITAFVRRFRLLERKLQDSRVPAYPEASRAIKLLDGLRLDERSTSSLLMAAGNKYDVRAILDAIKVQYPAGMSVTGLPLRAGGTLSRKASTKPNRTRRAWHADVSWNDEPEEVDYEETADVPDEPVQDNDLDIEYDEDEAEYEHAEQPDATHDDQEDEWEAAVQAFTVTSKRLADLTKARGYYNASDRKPGNSKGSSKGKGGKSKGKGKCKSAFKGGKSSGKGKKGGKTGKPSPTPGQADHAEQQKRIENALCLACGSASHWIADCPSVPTHVAQLTTYGMVLDPTGHVEHHQSWMTSTHGAKDVVQLPDLCVSDDCHDHGEAVDSYIPKFVEGILQNPKVLIQYANTDSSLMIVDTGCQRQVAGHAWHVQRQKDIQPLNVIPFSEHCNFAFGPNAGVPSKQRLAYPCGISGSLVVLGISEVSVNAPALLSRVALTWSFRSCSGCRSRCYAFWSTGKTVKHVFVKVWSSGNSDWWVAWRFWLAAVGKQEFFTRCLVAGCFSTQDSTFELFPRSNSTSSACTVEQHLPQRLQRHRRDGCTTGECWCRISSSWNMWSVKLSSTMWQPAWSQASRTECYAYSGPDKQRPLCCRRLQPHRCKAWRRRINTEKIHISVSTRGVWGTMEQQGIGWPFATIAEHVGFVRRARWSLFKPKHPRRQRLQSVSQSRSPRPSPKHSQVLRMARSRHHSSSGRHRS